MAVKKLYYGMINIAIIEDDFDFREGLQRYLRAQPDFTCELAAESMEEFLTLLPDATEPDVILMDIGLPGMSGISGMALLKEFGATVPNPVDGHRRQPGGCGMSGYCHRWRGANRDRTRPHDPAPPTPPGVRITYQGGSAG